MNGKNKYIIWTIFIIAALALFLWAGTINSALWKDVVKSVAAALLISGTFSVLHSVIEKREEETFSNLSYSVRVALIPELAKTL